jgi:hypothetical protein
MKKEKGDLPYVQEGEFKLWPKNPGLPGTRWRAVADYNGWQSADFDTLKQAKKFAREHGSIEL